MDRFEKHAKLMEAYQDPVLQKELEEQCAIIRKVIETFARSINRYCERIDNVFSVEARVKTAESFEEKIHRKNYIDIWEIVSDVKDNQSMIKHNLTDIIGVRINCYFYQFEEQLYNEFHRAESSFRNKGFDLNFKENTKQKNGHDIYKFSGVYGGEYRFEVQIKSVIHNVWGETEHKTVYKNLSYDGYINEKRTITNSLYTILKSSEDQLFSLFNMEETEDQLIRSLFFCYTKEDVAMKCKTKILAYHYENYFRAFHNQKDIKHYVISRLTGTQYPPIEINLKHSYDAKIPLLIEKFPVFYLECLYNIDSIIHVFSDFDCFLSYFLESIFGIENVDEFDEELMQTTDEIEVNENSQLANDIAVINEVFGNIIKNVKNDGTVS